MPQRNGLLNNNDNNNVPTTLVHTTFILLSLFKCISLRVGSIPSSSLLKMRLIELSLDQLSTNPLLCRLRYDSDSFSSESVPRIYKERKSNTKKGTEKKMRESQSNAKKKEENTVERKKWTVEHQKEERERGHWFYVILREVHFYGKIYPSLVIHPI